MINTSFDIAVTSGDEVREWYGRGGQINLLLSLFWSLWWMRGSRGSIHIGYSIFLEEGHAWANAQSVTRTKNYDESYPVTLRPQKEIQGKK